MKYVSAYANIIFRFVTSKLGYVVNESRKTV